MEITHLTPDDLVLHYYGEMTPEEETAAAVHLRACTACRAEYSRLQRVLGAVDEAAVSIDLPPSFDRTVWARLEPQLQHSRRRGAWGMLLAPAPLALAAMVVVLVVAAFFAGRTLSPPQGDVPSTGAAAAEHIRERILLVDLGDHLDRSQMVLVELVSADVEGNIDLSDERARAEQLVAANRLYRLAAAETGDVWVAELLDEIERVLTEVAASPDHVSAEELAEVRRRIEARDLLFKVRIVSSEVRERQRQALGPRRGQSS